MRRSISPASRRWPSWPRQNRASSFAKKEGDETARSWLDETERVIRQLLEKESG